MNTARHTIGLFFLIIALAGSGWYFASASPLFQLDDQTLSKMPDSMLTNLVVKQFNANGVLLNSLEAPEMHHIPEEDTHVFSSPHIVLTEEDNSNWDIRSKSATAIHKGEEITFNKQVSIIQSDSNKNSLSTITTEQLVYFAKEKIAKTQEPVTFIQAGTTVKSIGMKAYLASKHILLLHKAQAVYRPALTTERS